MKKVDIHGMKVFIFIFTYFFILGEWESEWEENHTNGNK